MGRPVQIREAQERDADALAHVLVTTSREAHRAYLPQEYLRTLTYEESASNWARTLRDLRGAPAARQRVFAAEDHDGRVVGVAMGGPLRTHPAIASEDPVVAGELYVLYVLPAWHRQGIGQRLVAAVACWLVGQGMRTMRVWTWRDNWDARRFYEALGGTLVGEHAREDEGIVLAEVMYAWADLDSLTR